MNSDKKRKKNGIGAQEKIFFLYSLKMSKRTHEKLLIVLISEQWGWRLGRLKKETVFTTIQCGRRFFLVCHELM